MLVPENGSICLVWPLDEGGGNGPIPWRDGGCYMPPPGPPEGGGGYSGSVPEDGLKPFVGGLSYDSQATLNRMTGNWWFPLDVFVVPQPNGDLLYYAPSTIGAWYVFDSATNTYTSPAGFFDSMVANGDGTWTRTTKHGTNWHFNTAGFLDVVTDRYGNATTITRNAQNRLDGWTDYAGRVTTVTYYPSGYASTITDSTNRAWLFTYTAQGYLASISYPSTTFFDRATQAMVTRAKVTSFQYITGTGTALDGNISQIIDDQGLVAYSMTYDSLDRAISTTTYGRTWSFSFLPSGNTRVVDPDGNTVEYSFNGAGAIATKTVFTNTGLGLGPLRPGEPTSYVWTYERNDPCGCGLITRVIRPDGTSTEADYDVWGNVAARRHKDAQGGSMLTETWAWSSFPQFCRMLTYTSPMGYEPGNMAADYTTTWTHDSLGSATQIAYPRAALTPTTSHVPTYTITRNALGHALSITHPGGTQAVYTHTQGTQQRATETYDPGGTNAIIEYGYDSLGRMTSRKNPRGYTTTWTYNALDQVVSIQGPLPLAPKATYVYDNSNNVYMVEVENKDETGALVSSNPAFTTTTTYDSTNLLVGVTTEIDASTTAATTLGYTAAGRLQDVTDPNGHTTRLTYDRRGLLHTSTGAYGAPEAATRVFNYDPGGRISSTIDPLGNTTSTQGPNPIGGAGQTFTYAYNAVGTLASVTYPGGPIEQRTVDSDERSTSVALASGPTLASYTWVGSRILKANLQNGVAVNEIYDALRRRTRVTYGSGSTTVRDFEYVHNLADQRLLEKRHHAAGLGDLYELDSLYRSVKIKEGTADPVAEFNNPGSQTVAATIVPTYDAANSRTNVAVTTASGTTNTSYTTDALNFYTTVGATAHLRDANGNLTDDGTHLYDYDYRNQLVRTRPVVTGPFLSRRALAPRVSLCRRWRAGGRPSSLAA